MNSILFLRLFNLYMNNMKINYLFYSLLMVLSISKLSSAQITFQKLYGGNQQTWANSVNLTSDSGYIVCGQARMQNNGIGDMLLLKLNANGDTLWSRIYGGISGDEAHCVLQTSDGGYILAGNTGSFGPPHAIVIKTDSIGNTLWAKTYGGPVRDQVSSIQQTSDNGFILAGWTQSFGTGNGNVLLIKTDGNGNILWTKVYGGSGPNADLAYSIRLTNDGGYILAGSGEGVFLIKTDSIGNILWSKNYGGSGGAAVGFDARQTVDGGYVATGWTNGFEGGQPKLYLLKTDSAGFLQWSETIRGNKGSWGNAVEQTSDHGYIIAGSILINSGDSSLVYLVKTDSAGTVTMSKTYGGVGAGEWDQASSVKQTNDGGYIIGGNSSFFTSNYMAYLIKTDAYLTIGCYEADYPATRTLVQTTVSPAGIFLSSGGIASIPGIQTGSGMTVETLCTTVGINDKQKDHSLSCYPDPFTDNLSVKGTSGNGIITLFDITGKEILQLRAANKETSINTSAVLSGLYMVRYTNGNNTSAFKVIKF
jgi:hypothetical protein